MSKTRLVLSLTLLLTVSTSAFAIGSQKLIYFSDYTFGTIVGARYTPDPDCPPWDMWWQWGTSSTYRQVWDYPECDEGGSPTVVCQVYNNGWQTVPCP